MERSGEVRRPDVLRRRSSLARPRFHLLPWIQLHGFDLLTMVILAVFALVIFQFGHGPKRSFPVFNISGDVVYPQIAYPVRPRIIPSWLSALLAVLVPLVFVGLFQIRRRSIEDFLTTGLGIIKALLTAVLCQLMTKWLIGGLRPNFLDVCKPDVQRGTPSGIGFGNIMYDQSVCTGDPKKLDEAMESMASGHAAAAWSTLLFLSLYFNAQLKVLSAHNPAYWKMVVFIAPLLGAFLISASLTVDHYHHWGDIVVGGAMGCISALVAYRQTFAAVFDFRFNHVLLPRSTSLFHRRVFDSGGGRTPYYTYCPTTQIFSSDLPFSREGGWGYGAAEQFVGAPGDATVLLSAMRCDFVPQELATAQTESMSERRFTDGPPITGRVSRDMV